MARGVAGWQRMLDDSPCVHTLQSKGRTHRYPSFAKAHAVASDVFARTGIVLGIECEGTSHA